MSRVTDPAARASRPDRSMGLAVGLAGALAALLLVVIGADPAAGVTGSQSPFTDEAWNVMNARNLHLLGTWSTDQFNLHLVNGPFSLLEAAVFSVLGVGMVQARLLSVGAVGLTILALAIGLRRPLGPWPALLAAAAFGTCFLVLYYGRLAYPENLVMLEMTVGLLVFVRAGEGRPAGERAVAWGLAGGLLFGLAVATKANAAFGIGGALIAIAVSEAGRSVAARRAIGGVLGGLALSGAAWIALVLLPSRDAVAIDLSIWPHQAAPDSIGALFYRIGGYAFSSDGGLPGLAPLAIGAGVGILATALGWRTLPPARRRLAVGAIGWLAVQLAVVLVASYRPNRYLLPLLPAAAILVGVAASQIATRRLRTAGPRSLPAMAAAAAVAVLVGPGLLADLGWASAATDRLGPMQRAVATILPPGAVVWGGYAPLVAMTAPVTTIVPWTQASANVGPPATNELVHWVVTGTHEPAWFKPASAGQRERVCLDWGGTRVCLIEVPAH